MTGTVLDWIARHWLEILTFLTTFAALIYAHLAYTKSAMGLIQAQKAELTSLRIQTKAALNEARQAQVSLELTCQVYRANWDSHTRKQGLMMRGPDKFFERSPIDDVRYEGLHLLGELDAASAKVDAMDLEALEALMQKAKRISLGIQALAGKLESPP